MPSESTVGRSVAINRQFHDAPGPWQSDKKEVDQEAIPKYLPYRPQYRHQMWFVDLRYLVKLDDRWVYVCVIAGYSRTVPPYTAVLLSPDNSSAQPSAQAQLTGGPPAPWILELLTFAIGQGVVASLPRCARPWTSALTGALNPLRVIPWFLYAPLY